MTDPPQKSFLQELKSLLDGLRDEDLVLDAGPSVLHSGLGRKWHWNMGLSKGLGSGCAINEGEDTG